MSGDAPDMPTEAWGRLEQILERFEDAWRRGRRPNLDEYLGAVAPDERRALLIELVQEDLEFRLKAGEPARVEDYLRRYPELAGNREAVLDLVAAEHEQRRRREPSLGPDEFLRRFPAYRQELLARLPAPSPPPAPAGPAAGGPADSVTAFVESVSSIALLRGTQAEELTGTLQTRFASPKALAKELLQRGWLTPYQANQLLQGRGPDLVLGQYVLLERLGQGGMGQVFKARHQRLHRIVALKLIRKERLADPSASERFQREAQAAARVTHPNIVTVYDADEVRGTLFFTMEYVEGTDLSRLVKRGGPLPVAHACDYARQAALGLQHAHENGLVHRDIKPANLLLAAKDGVVKILDMGLARLDDPTDPGRTVEGLTETGAVMGTPDYIAPEQAIESRGVDIRADIYSLGCTLYYMLAGRPPFAGGSLAQKLLCHQQAEPEPIERLRPDVPAGLAAVLRRMMAKRPADRYQTPAEAAVALERYCRVAIPLGPAPAADQTVPVARALPVAVPVSETVAMAGAEVESTPVLPVAIPVAARPAARPGRRRLVLAAAGSLALLLLAVGIVALLIPGGREGGEPPPTSLDQLRPEDVPEAEQFRGQPPELVAVLGDSRGRCWTPDTESPDAWVDPPHLAYRPGGKDLVAMARTHDRVRVWDPLTNRELPAAGGGATPFAQRQPVAGAGYTADGSVVALLTTVPAGWAYRVWDVTSGQERGSHLVGSGNVPAIVTFAPGGKRFAAGDGTSVRGVWDTATGKPLTDALPEPGRPYRFSADGKLLATAGPASGEPDPSLTVRLWHVPEGKPAAAGRLPLPPAKDYPGSNLAVAFTPDLETVAVANLDEGRHAALGRVLLWAWRAGQPSRSVQVAQPTGISALEFAPDGTKLAVTTNDGVVRVCDLSGNREPRALCVSPWSLAFAPNAKALAVATSDGTIRVWDTDTGRQLNPVSPALSLMAVAPGAPVVAVGNSDDNSLRILDAVTGKARGSVPLPPGSTFDQVALSPNGRVVAGSILPSHVAAVWDVATAEAVAPLESAGPLAFAPDGKTLVLINPNGQGGNLWDTAPWNRRAPLAGPVTALRAPVFSPKGRRGHRRHLRQRRPARPLGRRRREGTRPPARTDPLAGAGPRRPTPVHRQQQRHRVRLPPESAVTARTPSAVPSIWRCSAAPRGFPDSLSLLPGRLLLLGRPPLGRGPRLLAALLLLLAEDGVVAFREILGLGQANANDTHERSSPRTGFTPPAPRPGALPLSV
jgi:serine/threonine-protein kinase